MDQNQKCLQCGWLITIPPYGLGECSIHEGSHKQRDYCIDYEPLRRENAYCNPKCPLNGRLIRERAPSKVAASPESRPIHSFPIGVAVKDEFDIDENVIGAPIYFIKEKPNKHRVVVSILDPATRTRTTAEVIGSMRVCAA